METNEVLITIGICLVVYIIKKGIDAKEIAEFIVDVLVVIFRFFKWLIVGCISGFNKASTSFGGAGFLSQKEREKVISPSNQGVFIEGENRLSLTDSFEHILITASTGSGKTTKYCMPNLLGVDKSHEDTLLPSFVVTDPTNEIWNNCAGHLASQGYELKRLDFGNPDFTYGYNPLDNLKDISEVEGIADILVSSAYPQESADSSFWNDMARQIIGILCKCLMHPAIAEEHRNLYNVRFLLNSFGRSGGELQNFFCETTDEVIFQEIMGFLANDEKVLQGSLASAKSVLKIFSNPNVCKIMTYNTLRYETLREKPTALFISIPENKQKLYQPLLSLFYTELFGFLMQMPKKGEQYLPVFCFLEEAGNLYIPECSSYVTTLRKRQVSLSFIIQSESQLRHRYGAEEAETILGNLNTKVYFPGMDIETCQKLEHAIGNTTIVHTEPSGSFWSPPPTERYMGRSLLTADEIRTLKDPLLLKGSQQPIILENMKSFYKVKHLLKRSQKVVPEMDFSNDYTPQYIDIEKPIQMGDIDHGVL